jgi:hypothetical protein
MMIGIQGSRAFNDYNIFMHGMALPLRRLAGTEKELTILSAGPKRIKDMAIEFKNVSDFKSRGITVRVIPVPESWFRSNFYRLEMFSYFCTRKELPSSLANFLDSKDVDVQVHRYDELKR